MDELKNLDKNLNSIIDGFKNEISSIRTNRPTPKLVEDIKVDYFNQKMSVKQLGSISVAPPREIIISLWDKNAVLPVVRAIEGSGLGVGVNADGNLIRINLPPLTDERRQEFIKLTKAIAENQRIRIRSTRDDYNKKAKLLPEDQKFKLLKQIQEAIDKANKEIEIQLLNKISEINS